MHGGSESTTGLTCAPPEGGGESGEQPDKQPNRPATRSGSERPKGEEREGRGGRKERQQQQAAAAAARRRRDRVPARARAQSASQPLPVRRVGERSAEQARYLMTSCPRPPSTRAEFFLCYLLLESRARARPYPGRSLRQLDRGQVLGGHLGRVRRRPHRHVPR